MKTTSLLVMTVSMALGQAVAHPADAADGQGHVSHFVGKADYYHHKFYGCRTASGERLEKHKCTAAHRTLPFGTRVRVTNKTNGKSCVVVINDRGPFTKDKVIDLSHQAALDVDMIRAGTCHVECEVLGKDKDVAAKTVVAEKSPEKTVEKAAATRFVILQPLAKTANTATVDNGTASQLAPQIADDLVAEPQMSKVVE